MKKGRERMEFRSDFWVKRPHLFQKKKSMFFFAKKCCYPYRCASKKNTHTRWFQVVLRQPPLNFSLKKSPVFETSSRPYLLKYGRPLPIPTSSFDDSSSQTGKCFGDFFSSSTLPRVEQPLKRFAKENRFFCLGGGGYRRIRLLQRQSRMSYRS